MCPGLAPCETCRPCSREFWTQKREFRSGKHPSRSGHKTIIVEGIATKILIKQKITIVSAIRQIVNHENLARERTTTCLVVCPQPIMIDHQQLAPLSGSRQKSCRIALFHRAE